MRAVPNQQFVAIPLMLARDSTDHCTAQRRRPADSRFPAISPAFGRLGHRYSNPNPPCRRCGWWYLQCSEVVIRVHYPPRPARFASPCMVWGVRRARFGLSIPNGNVLQGQIEGGQGARQQGVACDWQALGQLDKPTRAALTSFLSVFDPQPKLAAARSRNSDQKRPCSLGTGGVRSVALQATGGLKLLDEPSRTVFQRAFRPFRLM